MIDRRTIQRKLICQGRYFLEFGILALFIYAGAAWILLVTSGIPFSFDGLLVLYRSLDMAYLLNLLPLLILLFGAWQIHRNRVREHRLKEQLNGRSSSIRSAIRFADEIGKGHLDFRISSNGDPELARSLDNMRKRILMDSRRESERNWVMEMAGEVGSILRNSCDLESMCDGVISFMVRNLENMVQGAIYVIDEEERNYEMKACYAYNKRKYMHGSFRPAEGLVGQAAVEKLPILRTEIPEGYMTISSGLIEEKAPTTLLFQPLLSDDRVYGVMELASFGEISNAQLRLMERLSETIARTIFNFRINSKTKQLLRDSRNMSDELKEQKKQLLEQAEEMKATQEELTEANQKLEFQIHEVHKSQKMTTLLLENASEIIITFSEDGTIRFVSPSIKPIMGYHPDELTGKHMTENIHPQDRDSFVSMFSDLISFPEQTRSLKYRYFSRKGEIAWLEATGKNLLSDPLINGILINSRDISVQLLAEKEQRIRAKMQALSENSMDIIIRIDIFSRCTYVNPVIEHYTGKNPGHFINKPLMEFDIDADILTKWKEILEEVTSGKRKLHTEMDFPSGDEKKIMKINAIPELYENKEIESVLIVCHDITEAKEREELIGQKNKSISDSINYAFYIQQSLLATEKEMREVLPNSFMIYKPKDVVSGDYPWFSVCGDQIFLGAMDCTGHGVPGALMSLIGYFLQNKILDTGNCLTAGESLDMLHTSVVKTLRQEDEESKTRDGMDAAFCRIDMKRRELQFAGAHRPLYFVSGGALKTIKGDKCPVGGVQYDTRKPFTTHTISVKPGDAMYIMTDGFPDQYGGPDGNQKYMSGRVKMLIGDHPHLSIFQMRNLFNSTFEEWKGKNEQLDDVLIIGVKF